MNTDPSQASREQPMSPMAAILSCTPRAHRGPDICAQRDSHPPHTHRCHKPVCGFSTHCLFLRRTGSRLGAPWGGRGGVRVGEAGGSPRPICGQAGWATTFPRLCRKPVCSESICTFRISLCLPRPERGMGPHIAPPEGWVQSVPRELPVPNHCSAPLLLWSLW